MSPRITALVITAALALAGLTGLAGLDNSVAYGQNTRIESFKRAKKELRKIYGGSYKGGKHKALYCGCEFSRSKISRKSCGYRPIRNDQKAQRIHWEHVVPASYFGRNFPAWKNGHPVCGSKSSKRNRSNTNSYNTNTNNTNTNNVNSYSTKYSKRGNRGGFKGRKCARRASEQFRRMEADMHNLYPAEGELETARKNLAMGIISGEKRKYGACDVEYTIHTIEPRPAVRGEIARAYLYMADTYPKYMHLTAKQRKMFLNWSKDDPVDEWEKIRNDKITKIQGNGNPYISGAAVIGKPAVAGKTKPNGSSWQEAKPTDKKSTDQKPFGRYGKRIKHNFKPKDDPRDQTKPFGGG